MNNQNAKTTATQELSDAQLESISGGSCHYYKKEDYCEKKYESCDEEYEPSYCQEEKDYSCEPKYDCEYERPRRHRRRHCSY